jgi:GTP-binding protein HflX
MKKAVIFSTSEDTEEIGSLLKNIDIEVVREFVQKRATAHRTGFMGPGKIDEIFDEMKSIDVDLIVVNGVLKPSQHHFLEMKFQKECIDRLGVILKIFTDHAHTQEAIAQVTLAKLRYELPFLREWIHKSKSGERPGFLAGGAYATDVYFQHAKTHTRRIEENLRELSKQREITRTKRREKGYSLVSLAGYTNAGKSALMNRLCSAKIEVDDRLFSTLATTTRRINGVHGNMLMSDTVGFIKDLPPDLIDAFNSTLEEIFYADLILLVFDASEDRSTIEMKLSTSLEILLPNIENRKLVVLGNKTDLISKERVRELQSIVTPIIEPYEIMMVSSVTDEGLEELRARIASIQDYSSTIEAVVPLTNEVFGFLSRLRMKADVSQTVLKDSVRITIRCKPEETEKIMGHLRTIGAVGTEVRTKASEASIQSEPVSTGNEGGPLH